MGNRDWLDAHRQELTPTRSDTDRLQQALETVRSTLSQEISIAEIHPCGSAAKGTMLRGRNEGDLVVIQREAPTSQTLERYSQTLSALPHVESAKPLYKAVQTKFKSGVSVDVLPAALHGVTEPGDSIPRKHRHALDGPKHVQWFQQAGHAVGAHDSVRLSKGWRDHHGLPLSSFGLEVLTVEVLRSLGSAHLDTRFQAVLERLARGDIAVVDPIRSSNWINQLSPDDRQRVMRAAQESLTHLQNGQARHVFMGSAYPQNVRGLSSTPLA